MIWTIEKVKELPENNWLGIKRVGLHIWEIGGDIPGGMTLWTGDGGVVEYCNSFNENMKEAANKYKPVLEEVKEVRKPRSLNITYEELESIVQQLIFPEKDGMD